MALHNLFISVLAQILPAQILKVISDCDLHHLFMACLFPIPHLAIVHASYKQLHESYPHLGKSSATNRTNGHLSLHISYIFSRLSALPTVSL